MLNSNKKNGKSKRIKEIEVQIINILWDLEEYKDTKYVPALKQTLAIRKAQFKALIGSS